MKTAFLFVALLSTTLCTLGACTGVDATAADNTGTNERDRHQANATPMDQSESPSDLSITQQVRQGVMKNDSLSMMAKNVKIITRDGIVTFRGPVKSDKEKTDIIAVATKTPGVKTVSNLLEVASN